jgi:beta-galactosidase GanA
MDKDGIFRADGFAANLRELTGSLVRTVRWMGSTNSPPPETAHSLGSSSMTSRVDPEVEWKGGVLSGFSPVGLQGYTEFLEVDSSAEAIATFKSSQAILHGRPAAIQRKLGRGVVVKLAFWPDDDSLVHLVEQFAPASAGFLAAAVPQGVVAVPRTDNSLFVVNTTGREMPVKLARSGADRLSGTNVTGNAKLRPYQVWWLA